jgi:HPt (histidine-containing phosphotransfer) domain-containing protein
MDKILDLNYLDEISAGDPAFIKEMLQLFIDTTAIEVNDFDALVESKQWESIGKLAHKIKAPIQMLGGNELYDLVKTIEVYGKDQINTHEIPNLVANLKQKIMQLTKEIEQMLNTL